MMSKTQFNATFNVIPNRADGNCFFEVIEYFLKNTAIVITPTAGEIRRMVGNFYRDFDRYFAYPEHTIEYKIKRGLGDGGDEMQHIWNNYVWASMTDVLVCVFLFEINIRLYTKVGELYHLENITSQYLDSADNILSVDILYNGINHFEAIVPQRGAATPTEIASHI